jgi:hypothetical protein
MMLIEDRAPKEAPEFTAKGAYGSVEFKEGGKGTTLDVIVNNTNDPQLLVNMANQFAENKIPIDAVIADLKNEIAALPPQERAPAVQKAYDALNSRPAQNLAWSNNNQRLDELANEFNMGIANAMISDGQIFGSSDMRNPMNHDVRIIQPGETLGDLAKAHPALTAGYLARENGIANPDAIRAGDSIMVPSRAYVDRQIRGEYLLYSFANTETGFAVPSRVANFDPATGESSAIYGRFGNMQGLQAAAGKEYQRLVDAGYEIGVKRYEEGRITGLNKNQAIGTFMDQYARDEMRLWLGSEGIDQGHENPAQVFVNRRLYDADGLNFRLPDLRIGGQYFDASLELKSEKTS